MKIELDDLIRLRHQLHKFPDLSGDEANTAVIVQDFLIKYNPNEFITNIGGNSFAVVYNSGKEGPTVLIRADLDALPINEQTDINHASYKSGISHKCGHDGHMTILVGVAQLLNQKKPEKGKVILLFQAEEETGEGALKVLRDPKFKSLDIDYVFALHNMPGYEEGSIIITDNTFASSSKGMILKLHGKSSHAAEPEKGISPISAVKEMIQEIETLNRSKSFFKDFILITIVHLKLGDKVFGTSPGYGELMATIRSTSDEDMNLIIEKLSEIITRVTQKERLSYEIDLTEEFPALVNDKECVELIEELAQENDYSIIKRDEAFRFSEDFAHFTNHYKGAMFGLGSGVNTPSLHSTDYDFPDKIIENGVMMLYGICEALVE